MKSLFLFCCLLSFSQNVVFPLNTSNPKGSSTVYALSFSEPYTSSSEVWGWVNYHGGFSLSGTNTLKIGISPHVKVGDVVLYNGSCIELMADLHLSSATNISIGASDGDVAYVRGNSGVLFFHGDSTLPANRNLFFLNDTIIDGQSNTISLDDGFQFIVETNTTLTLRNMHISGLKGSASGSGGIILRDETSNLALQNVSIDLGGTYTFDIGSLFIHEDVVFTGSVHGDVVCTSSIKRDFVHYSSGVPQSALYISNHSSLIFNSGTSFVYDHYDLTNDTCRQQLIMTDTTSALYLDGATLSVPAYGSGKSGLELWLGMLILDNRVTLSNYNQSNGLVNTDDSKGIFFGRGAVDLNVFVHGGARIDLFGTLNYLNRY